MSSGLAMKEITRLMKCDIKILFDRQITSKNDFVFGIHIIPILIGVDAAINETGKGNSKNKIYLNKLHQILGHCGEKCKVIRKSFGLSCC
jgi:hypothetical protein